MKFATIPTTPESIGPQTKPPAVMCFPMAGLYTTQQYEPQALTPYPISLTLAEAVEYYWRIKEFEAVISHSFFGTKRITLHRVNETPFDDERQLLTPTGPDGRFGALWTGFIDESVFGQQTRTIFVDVIMFYTDQTEPVVSHAYFFKHEPLGDSDVANIIPSAAIYVYGFWDAGSELVIDGRTDEELEDSESIAAHLHNSNVEFVMATGGIGGLESLTITPTAFFTWANPDGTDPTWDEFTGEKV